MSVNLLYRVDRVGKINGFSGFRVFAIAQRALLCPQSPVPVSEPILDNYPWNERVGAQANQPFVRQLWHCLFGFIAQNVPLTLCKRCRKLVLVSPFVQVGRRICRRSNAYSDSTKNP
jgi:hypothetical protein